ATQSLNVLVNEYAFQRREIIVVERLIIQSLQSFPVKALIAQRVIDGLYVSNIMILILILLHSIAARASQHSTETTFLNSDLEQLLKILSEENGNDVIYYSELETAAFRYNYSLPKCTSACLNSYNQMKLSPADSDWPTQINTTYSIFMKWSNFVIEAKSKANKLVANIFKFMDDRRFINPSPSPSKIASRNKLLHVEIAASTTQVLQSILLCKLWPFEIALRYKRLSAGAKFDLEQSTCIHQTLRWLNRDMNNTIDSYFAVFSDAIGELNIDGLLEDNYYLSKKPLYRVKEQITRTAHEINIPVQDYADICAEIISTMRVNTTEILEILTNREDEEQIRVDFFGKEWGNYVYNSSEELIEKLIKNNSLFFRIFSERRNFVMNRSHILLNRTQQFLKKADFELHDSFLKLNNRAATKQNYETKLFSENLIHEFNMEKQVFVRDMERVFCAEFCLENVYVQHHVESLLGLKLY
ncbi:hypothetical protein PRIPAC_81620, partial [Pristionchus pacificus]|uniref:Uncharacterized protein n=1 Tax=Pristionchus pacificus TaxID=54126 RepID=A0A2A6BXL6_PRIPA